jgi:hypothetical protein
MYSPTVNLTIEPDGDVLITSTHDQVILAQFKACGGSFPSQCPSALLRNAALRIGKKCYTKNIIGMVTIDFVVCSDEGVEGGLSLQAIGLHFNMTPTSASFAMFDLLMQGRYITPKRAALSDYKQQVRRCVCVCMRVCVQI